ncbi:hypothetical protein GCK32_007232, partial [Trichostrongylus colubriformis]
QILFQYVGMRYTSNLRTKTPSAASNMEGRKTKDIKSFILKESRRVVASYCEESSHSCYTIEDRPALENNSLVVQRVMLYKDSPTYSLSTVELETPQELTWKNFNSRQWSVNRLVVRLVYTKLMIAMGFVMEALQFDPQDWQNVLLIGLGGGAQNNFLSVVDFIMVNLTSIELSPTMVSMAKDWFGLVETQTNTVLVEDGVEFVHAAAQQERYKAILLDASGDASEAMVCPAKVFMQPSVIQDIASVLDDDGVLTVNILSGRDFIANEDEVLATYKPHFATCFLLRYSAAQRMLVCTHRKDWSFDKQRTRFMENFRMVDDRFDFALTDIISREN